MSKKKKFPPCHPLNIAKDISLAVPGFGTMEECDDYFRHCAAFLRVSGILHEDENSDTISDNVYDSAVDGH